MPKRKSPVVDVHVTRDMIHYAVTQTSTQCAIALALRDADIDGNFVMPHVDQESIRISDRQTGQRYTFTDVPAKIKNWIDQFDRDPSKVRPFSFQLDLSQADEVRPIRHLSPSEAVAQYHRDVKTRERRKTQRRIPAAERQEIVHTSKRELRDVKVPRNAGNIGE